MCLRAHFAFTARLEISYQLKKSEHDVAKKEERERRAAWSTAVKSLLRNQITTSLSQYIRAHKANCFSILFPPMTICSRSGERMIRICYNHSRFIDKFLLKLLALRGIRGECWTLLAGIVFRLCVSLIKNQCIECENIYDVMPSREFFLPCNSPCVSIGISSPCACLNIA